MDLAYIDLTHVARPPKSQRNKVAQRLFLKPGKLSDFMVVVALLLKSFSSSQPEQPINNQLILNFIFKRGR